MIGSTPGLARWAGGEEPSASARHARDMGSIPGSNPWVGKILWKGECLPTPLFLPGESHGQRSLSGCLVPGGKESDMTEVT